MAEFNETFLDCLPSDALRGLFFFDKPADVRSDVENFKHTRTPAVAGHMAFRATLGPIKVLSLSRFEPFFDFVERMLRVANIKSKFALGAEGTNKSLCQHPQKGTRKKVRVNPHAKHALDTA